MDTAELGVVVGGVLLIGFILWFFFGTPEEDAKRVSTQQEPLYACPMHPWITSTDASAECSICGMKLVRHDDNTTQHHSAISSRATTGIHEHSG